MIEPVGMSTSEIPGNVLRIVGVKMAVPALPVDTGTSLQLVQE